MDMIGEYIPISQTKTTVEEQVFWTKFEDFDTKGSNGDINPTKWSGGLPKSVPFTLGTRWLAFPDTKLVYQHLSRCGDASSDESEPLTSTVMNVNKRIWDSLSSLVSTAKSSAGELQRKTALGVYTGQAWSPTSTGPSADRKELTQSTCTAGNVSVVDLALLAEVQAVTPASPDPTREQCVFTGTRYVNVHDYNGSGCLVAHFMAHRWANVALLKFDPTGSLLLTACSRGHSFNLFRLSNHPCDSRQTAVHHLYILERGNIPCEPDCCDAMWSYCSLIVDATFSHDSRWLSVSSNHGTTHIFPITPYGGTVTVRTHTRPYVVNRTSRYHRTSGLEEHQLTRPQRERASLEPLVSNTSAAASAAALSNSVFGDIGSGTAYCTTGSGASATGFLSSCPHLSVHMQTTSQAMTGYCGDSEFPVGATGQSSTAYFKGLCACPSNAKFNMTNPRLPPYPEPCQLRPEARLRPHNAAGSTGGVAAAAFEAATGVASSAKSSVTSSTVSSGSLLFPYSSHPGGGVLGNVGHRGPCVHYRELVSPTANPPQFPGNRVALTSVQHHQPLPTVGTLGSAAYDHHLPMPRFSGIMMAAQFGSPICFLPRPARHNTNYDPYGGKSRIVDSLFILTGDLYLVEYDLCVLPTESQKYSETLYQDGSIRLECTPVGEWNLRTDAVMLPPFSADHPWLVATQSLHSKSVPVSESCGGGDHRRSTPLRTPSTSLLFEVEGYKDPEPEVIDETNTPVGECSPGQPTVAVASALSSPPAGWSVEDVASYWYSQVEVTTHLGPLRRIWMGPQFSFHTYSTRSAPPCIQLTGDLASGTGQSGLHPSLLAVLSSPSANLCPTTPDDLCSFQSLTLSSQTDSTGASPTTLTVVQSGHSPSTLVGELWDQPPVSAFRYPRTAGGGAGQSLQHQKQRRLRKSRTQSGEVVSTQPINIASSFAADTDMGIFIEGGSYQNSSLGSSLSSLIGRNLDDVSQFIAEAMQDDETQLPSVDVAPVGLRTVLTTNVRATLSEADFPSQDTSPLGRVEALQSDYLAQIPTTLPPALRDASDQKEELQPTAPLQGDSNSDSKETFSNRPDTAAPKVVKRVKTKPKQTPSGKKSHRNKTNNGTQKQQSSLSSPRFSGSASLASSPGAISLPETSVRHLNKPTVQSGDDSPYRSSNALQRVGIRRTPTEPNVRLSDSAEDVPAPSTADEQMFDAE